MSKSSRKLAFKVGHEFKLSPATDLTANHLSRKYKLGDLVYMSEQEPMRSLSQNALSHVWYASIEQQLTWDPGDGRRHCKLHFGIPVLAEDAEFAERYTRTIKNRFTYEEKLELMDWFPVTSLMTERQKSRYLETIQRKMAAGNVVLETPKDSEYAKWQEKSA